MTTKKHKPQSRPIKKVSSLSHDNEVRRKEFCELLEITGKKKRATAAALEVGERTLWGWIRGEYPVPGMALLALKHLASARLQPEPITVHKILYSSGAGSKTVLQELDVTSKK